MEKKSVSLLCFMMVAIFAMTFVGIASAEEISLDIPVIEEVSEEELTEVLPEDVEIMEVAEPAETDYFQVLTVETHKGYYADLASAVAAAADGDTVKMLKDYSYGATIALGSLGGKSVIIDGGSHTLTDTFIRSGEHDFSSSIVFQSGTITLKNINITATAASTSQAHTQGFITINADGKLILDAGTKIYGYYGTNGTAVWCNSGSAVAEILDGVEISGCYGGGQGVVGVYVGTVYMKGGEIKNNTLHATGNAVGILDARGNFYMSGGSITGNSGGINSKGEVVISGTAVVKDNVSFDAKKNTGSFTVASDFEGTLTLSPDHYFAAVLEDPAVNDGTKIKHTGSMGLVSETNEDGTASLYWDCVATINNVSCYSTIEDAIAASDTADETIYLKKDVTSWKAAACAAGKEDHINIAGSSAHVLNIEGEGHTISTKVRSTAGSHRFFVVYQGAKVNIKNVKFDGGGVFDFVTVHNATDSAGTTVSFENCSFENGLSNNYFSVIGGTLNLTKCHISGATKNNVIQLQASTTCVNQENQVNIKGCTIDNSSATNQIYISAKGNLNIGAADDGTKTIIKNCTGGLGTAINVNANAGNIVIDNLVVENCKTTYEAAGAIYVNTKATITNSEFKGNSSVKHGGAMYIAPGAADTVITNCRFTGNDATTGNGGAIYICRAVTFKNNVFGCDQDCAAGECTHGNKGTYGGAIFAENSAKLTFAESNIIKGNTATTDGGGIDTDGATVINLSGMVDISGNNVGGKENNISLTSAAQVNVAGNLSEGSAIGITKALSASTIAKAASADITGVEAFFADAAPVPVCGTYFANTIGDGALADGGNSVIDMTEVNARKSGRELDIVLHWPWRVSTSSGDYGYVSLYEAKGKSDINSKLIMQKDMNAAYQWTEHAEEIKETETREALFRATEFPMFTYNSTNGVITDSNHIDLWTAAVLDGNGHVLTSDKIGNQLFVLFGGNKTLNFNNFIYNGLGNKSLAQIHKGASKGTEVINVINSHIVNGESEVIYIGNGGTLNAEDSLIGKVNIELNATLNVAGDTYTNVTNAVTFVDNTANLSIGADFKGKLVVSGDAARIKAGDGFASLNSIESIVKAGTDGKTFAYYKDGTFAWANLPEVTLQTDSGIYNKDAESEEGVIRFMTTFNKVDADSVVSYGSYALGVNNFSGTMDENKGFASFSGTPADGKSYIVDLVGIDKESYDDMVYTMSFVKFAGIDTPWFVNFNPVTLNTATDRVKDLGEKQVEAEGQAA